MKIKRPQQKLRTIFVVLIILSIYIIYYTTIVKKDYIVFENPEGPDTSDYFEE